MESSVSSKDSKRSLIWSHFTQIGSDSTNMIRSVCSFETDDNYAIRFEISNNRSPIRFDLKWKKHYSHSTSTSWVCWCTDASTTMLLGTWWTTDHQSLTLFADSVCVQPAVTNFPCHATVWECTAVGCFLLLADCLELTAWRPSGSGLFCRHLLTVAKDIFVLSVLVCPSH